MASALHGRREARPLARHRRAGAARAAWAVALLGSLPIACAWPPFHVSAVIRRAGLFDVHTGPARADPSVPQGKLGGGIVSWRFLRATREVPGRLGATFGIEYVASYVTRIARVEQAY